MTMQNPYAPNPFEQQQEPGSSRGVVIGGIVVGGVVVAGIIAAIAYASSTTPAPNPTGIAGTAGAPPPPPRAPAPSAAARPSGGFKAPPGFAPATKEQTFDAGIAQGASAPAGVASLQSTGAQMLGGGAGSQYNTPQQNAEAAAAEAAAATQTGGSAFAGSGGAGPAPPAPVAAPPPGPGADPGQLGALGGSSSGSKSILDEAGDAAQSVADTGASILGGGS